jgi:hypothetical protein
VSSSVAHQTSPSASATASSPTPQATHAAQPAPATPPLKRRLLHANSCASEECLSRLSGGPWALLGWGLGL